MKSRAIQGRGQGIVGVGLLLIGGSVQAETIRLPDLQGKIRTPLAQKGQKATLCFFITHDCPIANQYAPEIERIYRQYAPRKVTCWLVYVDPTLKAEQARTHSTEFGYSCPALLDTKHQLVQKAGATLTPEAVLFGPDGRRLYCGRIDDRFADWGKGRATPKKRDLREALDAVLQGKPAPNPTTKAVGCFIPPL